MCCFADSCDVFFLSELSEWLFLFVVCAAKLLLFFELCNTQNAVSDRFEANGSLRTRDSLLISVNQNVNQHSDPSSSHARKFESKEKKEKEKYAKEKEK